MSNEALETLDMSVDVINNLACLFTAIRKEAVKGGQIHGLSTLGEYQGQDWANQFDLIRARLEREDGIKPVNGGKA